MKRLIVALILQFAPASATMAAGLIEDSITLPARFEGTFGSYTANLDALVIRPNDSTPHPLAVINHGTPVSSIERRQVLPKGFRAQAQEFARRGWIAITFTRRGFGNSEGAYAENSSVSCDSRDYEPVGRASADDIREVIRLMREKPYVDGSKIISVGRSAGGFATVALTANPPPGLVAAISFAGGHGSSGTNHVCNEIALIDAFATFGKTSRVPMLWVYADNDHYFSPALAQRMVTAFTEAGGNAEFIAAPPFGTDGHGLFSRAGTAIWSHYVDAFLEKQNLKLVDQPLPIEDHVRYPTGLSDRGKAAFLDFLDAAGHKAFVISADEHFGWSNRRETAEDAVEKALEICKNNTDRSCSAVMIDDQAMP
ncbi:MAG TPA: CocE/NonD family hydrolase [Telmatospirillum sp.]|nr:CocE/NonD family hydrolase [Telmatospirillum sp.]